MIGEIALCYLTVKEISLFLEKELIFIKILEGSVIVNKSNKDEVLHKNDLLIIHPETPFVIKKNIGHNLLTLLRLDRDLCKNFDYKTNGKVYSGNSAQYEKDYPEVYQELRFLLESITRFEVFENKSELNIYLKKLYAHMNKHFDYVACGNLHKEFSEKMKLRYQNLYFNYFEINSLNCQDSLKDISKHLDLNYDYLRKDIKHRFGYNYHQLKDILRVNYATKYVLSTEMNITDISFRTGFSDHKYMVACFRKRYGMPPSELRLLRKTDTPARMYFMKSI
ncbi:MAG: helix-turn-helix transcriptional regulator [Clostridiales bacterium]|nr:helix-turn-helix transcriptional regulator [Clostridiales bacterium]